MELGKILEFRKDLYFEGAVQADWFYSPDRASKVAENFVFHGNTYFGIEDQGLGTKKRIDTISLVKELVGKLDDERSNSLSLAVADYGTGKSHLAVTMAQIFSGSEYMPETYKKILDNIAGIDSEAAQRVEQFSKSRNFVIVINGMRDFNLHSEILKATQKSMKLYGLPDDCLRKLNRAIETAEIFFGRNANSLIELFEAAAKKRDWSQSGNALISKIRETLMVDDEAFEIVNEVYAEINGRQIRWDEGLSATSILEMLVSEYCGMNGIFDHIVILFDEFGRYLEYASGVNAAKSGESGLQQIYELTQKTQNVEGYLHVINFIQRDIKAYLQTIDQTKNISRYIGRFDESEKYYISSNLETVFANLIQRKDKVAFNELIIKWQNEHEADWKNIYSKLNKWLITKGMWKEYKLFRKVAVEGIYPLHPISTFMLTNLSDYLQNRSSLTIISRYIEECSDVDISKYPMLIMPEQLITGDLYTEMLSAEQEGRQKTQQCIKYDNAIRKFEDKLSDKSLAVLRSNLILRILRFRTTDYEDAKEALSLCSGLVISEVENELKWLEDEYAILEFDNHAGVFDFTEESNGAHDFKIIKRRLISDANVNKSVINNIKIQDLAGISEPQRTNFDIQHNITTTEWVFTQKMYPIEDLSKSGIKSYTDEWKQATGSKVAKGKLIWLYVNKDTEPEYLEFAQKCAFELVGKPIILMLLNDIDNRMFESLVEYTVLDNMDDLTRKKYDRYFQEDLTQAENNLKYELDSLKKQRLRIQESGICQITSRMPAFLTSVFEDIYSEAIPFFFDGFVTNKNNITKKTKSYFCSFLNMLLSNTTSEATIHSSIADIRNRVEALFFKNSATSWKCINEQYKVTPPEEKKANAVYEQIVDVINEKGEIACGDIYDTYCMPPYGMSEDVVTLMIAVICANLSYCLRVRCGELKSINSWKDDIIKNVSQDINLNIIKSSVIVFVDAGAVTGKYMRFFDKIKNNRNITEVAHLSTQLEQMVQVDEVPEELESAYLLAQKNLASGKKACNEWAISIGKVVDKLEEAEDNTDLYNALEALEALENIHYTIIFDDNGYEYDEYCKEKVKTLRSELDSFIREVIDPYVASMYCQSVEATNTFRNHNNKMQNKLDCLGYHEFANRIKVQKDKELNNKEEIQSRQTLIEDYKKYIQDSRIDRFTTFMNISAILKNGIELSERVDKYKNSLGKDSEEKVSKLAERIEELNKAKNRINQDMTDIWDDLFEVKNSEDVEDLLDRIALVLQKGISTADQTDFTELQENLQELLIDINSVKDATQSRKKFVEISEQMKEKYAESEFDFEVLPILEEVICEISKALDVKENNWKEHNLSLGDKSRSSVHKWKEKIEFLPEYLSEDTLSMVKRIEIEADNITSENKMEDVIFYFEKLDVVEKKKCFAILKDMLVD